VTAIYADSSALIKLVVDEPESGALRRFLDRCEELTASRIAVVEVRRAVRLARPANDHRALADEVLDRCSLLAVSDEIIERAGDLASPRLRSLDAIHLASALRVECRQIITYDGRLAEAAAAKGLEVLAPGATG
jgi:predicted nucleic acid-binding protein